MADQTPPTLVDPLRHCSTDQALAVLQLAHYLEELIWQIHGRAISQRIANDHGQDQQTPIDHNRRLDDDPFDIPF